MEVHSNIQNLPAFRNAVITIGTFDGVHTGHQQILRQLKTEASLIPGESVVITFHPHPKMVVSSVRHDIKVLNTMEEKINLLSQKEIDHLVVVPFTETFAELSAQDYIKSFLVAHFHPHTIIIGYDHRFGKDRLGDYHLLEEEASSNGYIVKEIPEHVLQNLTISSTKIRTALHTGDIITANEFLGYEYFFSGEVIEGNRLGTTIGFPTANLFVEDDYKLIPGNGVYSVEVNLNDNSLTRQKGMMNIGVRPTLGGTKRVIEVNIFDFNLDIYGKTITVYLNKHLRNEKKFSGLEQLKEHQMHLC